MSDERCDYEKQYGCYWRDSAIPKLQAQLAAAEARERGGFTAEDVALPYDYCTCAVGEQGRRGVIFDYTALGHFLNTPAFDADLYDLGGYFYSAVLHSRVDEAEDLLDRIEARALTIKRETRA